MRFTNPRAVDGGGCRNEMSPLVSRSQRGSGDGPVGGIGSPFTLGGMGIWGNYRIGCG